MSTTLASSLLARALPSRPVTDLTDLTLAEARDLLRAKSISSRELVEAHLAAIDAANDALNAFGGGSVQSQQSTTGVID